MNVELWINIVFTGVFAIFCCLIFSNFKKEKISNVADALFLILVCVIEFLRIIFPRYSIWLLISAILTLIFWFLLGAIPRHVIKNVVIGGQSDSKDARTPKGRH